VFSRLTQAAVGVTVSDSQCGFKMFRADASRKLFRLSKESGYIFDVEILGLAARLKLRVDEVGIDWTEVAGFKVRLFRDGLKMLYGVLRVRRSLNRLPDLRVHLPDAEAPPAMTEVRLHGVASPRRTDAA
jgi:dolichyl-phosphate beta-glucosyltransferase